MRSKKAQTSQLSLVITPEILRPVNSLTRASPKPGFLDYTTYLRLLIRDGHVEDSHPACNPHAPAQPVNSSLQVVSNYDRRNVTTDFRADQALWSQNDLPHVLYLLQPPSNWINEKYLKDPPSKTYKIQGNILRDIPILPDHISSKLEGWRLQAWYCFDPRVRLGDILARMGNAVNGSTVQMRSLRFRTDCPALGWANKGPKFHAEKVRIEGLMRDAGLDPAGKTTRGLAWGAVDPDDEDSSRIEIPSKKGWDSSVEKATAAHLNPIASSSTMSRLFNSATPAQLPSNALHDDRHHYWQPSDDGSDCTISDGQADDTEEDIDMLETYPTPQTRTKRKLVAPHESASKRQDSSGRVNQGLLLTWTPPANANFEGRPQFTALNGIHHHLFEDTSQSGNPPPEEVPRAPSIAYPLEYQQWLADDLQNAVNLQTSDITAGTDDKDVFPGVHYVLEDSGIVRALVLYTGRWLGLKTPHERQNLSDDGCQLLNSFFPVGSEGRFQQIEYLLDTDQAHFGFEDRNGQWGDTNWDLNMESNIRYAVSQMEASALLAARMGQLEERQVPYDDCASLRFHFLLVETAGGPKGRQYQAVLTREPGHGAREFHLSAVHSI